MQLKLQYGIRWHRLKCVHAPIHTSYTFNTMSQRTIKLRTAVCLCVNGFFSPFFPLTSSKSYAVDDKRARLTIRPNFLHFTNIPKTVTIQRMFCLCLCSSISFYSRQYLPAINNTIMKMIPWFWNAKRQRRKKKKKKKKYGNLSVCLEKHKH